MLLPGADLARHTRSPRACGPPWATSPSSGCEITMSFGVNASDGAAFDFPALLAEADAALYAAKAAGRDCTRTAGDEPQIASAA